MKSLLSRKRVLVTGAGGFIGHRLAESLVAFEGCHVVALLAPWSRRKVPAGCHVRYADVTDYQQMCNLLSSEEIEHVFHLAGSAIVRVSARDPMTTYRNNVMGTVALLEAVRTVGKTVERVVVASSDKAYGDHLVLPYRENFALQPKNTYDASKACADMIARAYGSNYSLPICVTRCSNVYGPLDENISRIVPNTIRRIFWGQRPMLYSDIEKMEREFIFVDDVVEAYRKLLHVDPYRLVGEAFNIGGNGPMKIRDLVQAIWDEMMGPQLDLDDWLDVVPRHPEFKEIEKQCIDSSRLYTLTGWEPKTSLEQGIAITVDAYTKYFKENP